MKTSAFRSCVRTPALLRLATATGQRLEVGTGTWRPRQVLGTRTGCRDIGRTVVAVRATMHQTGVLADVVHIKYGSVPEVGEGKVKRQGSRPTKGNSARDVS
jgi:hypothetical protein